MATAKELAAAERAAAREEAARRRSIRTYEAELRDEQWECLANGHWWPRLTRKPGRGGTRALPKGFRAARIEGGWQLVEQCLNNCGKERISDHTPGQGTARRYLTDTRKWKTRPEGMQASRVDFLEDLVDDIGAELFR